MLINMPLVMEILIILGGILLGYVGGRYKGYKLGYKAGATAAPLLLRQKSLAAGHCVLCQSRPTFAGYTACRPEGER